MNCHSCLRYVLIVLGTFLLSTAAPAQDLYLGGAAGVNFSTFRGDVEDLSESVSDPDFRRRVSFQIGGFALIRTRSWLSLQPELRYIQKGSVMEGTALGGGGVIVTYRFSYLEAPLLLKVHLTERWNLTPHILFGPSFSVNTASGAQVDFAGESRIRSFDDLTTSTNVAGVVGAGIELQTSGERLLTFDVRYNPGLSNISSEEETDLWTDSITFSLGYGFSM